MGGWTWRSGEAKSSAVSRRADKENAQANAKELQRFLGHADQRSTEAYIVLAGADVKDLVRGKP